MAVFYRGAGLGTYWHGIDARITGFNPHFAGAGRTIVSLVNHIKNGTTTSPYVSLTRSYSVAWCYAIYCGHSVSSVANPAFVYEVEINDPPPAGLVVLDPVCEIAQSAPSPLSAVSYQHDGLPDFLIGVVDPRAMGHLLATPIKHPPPGGATARPANLSAELETLVRALRDAEILAVGTIPAACVTQKYPVA
jgi:hypothetical protein